MTFATGLSSLRAHQTALSVVGNNIANASTEGFRRQEVVFEENPHVTIGGLSIGTGVSIAEVRSAANSALESALTDQESEGATLAAKLHSAEQMDAFFIPGTGTLQERTEDLFLDLERLSALPTDATLRSSVVHSADKLAEELRHMSDVLASMTKENELQITDTLARIEKAAGDVASLNAEVNQLKNAGSDAADVMARRDIAVRELAKLIDVEKRITGDGDDTYVIGNGLFSVGGGLEQLSMRRNEQGNLEIWREGCEEPHEINSGELGGLLAQNNEAGGIQGLKDKLSEFSTALIVHLDTAHATGVGIGGAFTDVAGARSVDDSASRLADQATIIPVTRGTLHISVNDEAGNTTTLETVDIDPQLHSLDDVATLISGLDHLSARTDNMGRISIVAESGYSFDFTGNLQTQPDASGLTGTTDVSVSGRYSGSTNEEFELRFLGSGTVGVTNGLQAEVLNRAGQTVRVLDVGTDYEPSSNVTFGDGIQVALSSGTVFAGQAITITAPAQPDETNFLAAMGLNTLFVGGDLSNFEVNSQVLDNPSRLATTTNGDPSDTRNLHRMLAIRDARLLRDGTITLEQLATDIAADAGRELEDLTQDMTAFEEQLAFLEGQVEAANGVDVNQELTRMLQYQRSYQAAARYISTIDQVLQQLFNIIR